MLQSNICKWLELLMTSYDELEQSNNSIADNWHKVTWIWLYPKAETYLHLGGSPYWTVAALGFYSYSHIAIPNEYASCPLDLSYI